MTVDYSRTLIGFRSINKRSVILGEATALDGLSNWITRHASHGFSFAGTFSTCEKAPSTVQLPWLGSYAKLEGFLQKNKIHQLVVLPDRNMDEWIPFVTDLASQHGCRVLIYNSLSGFFDSRLVFVEEGSGLSLQGGAFGKYQGRLRTSCLESGQVCRSNSCFESRLRTR